MPFIERDLYLAQTFRGRELWANHYLDLELQEEQRAAFAFYRFLNEQAATNLLLRFGAKGDVRSCSGTVFERGSADPERLISELRQGTVVSLKSIEGPFL